MRVANADSHCVPPCQGGAYVRLYHFELDAYLLADTQSRYDINLSIAERIHSRVFFEVVREAAPRKLSLRLAAAHTHSFSRTLRARHALLPMACGNSSIVTQHRATPCTTASWFASGM